MLAFLRTQWKGMVAVLAVLLVALNLYVLIGMSALVYQRSAEAHAVFEQLRGLIEAQQKAVAQPKGQP